MITTDFVVGTHIRKKTNDPISMYQYGSIIEVIGEMATILWYHNLSQLDVRVNDKSSIPGINLEVTTDNMVIASLYQQIDDYERVEREAKVKYQIEKDKLDKFLGIMNNLIAKKKTLIV